MSMAVRELPTEVIADVSKQARVLVSELMHKVFDGRPITPAQADINLMILRLVASRLLASQIATGIANDPEKAKSREVGMKFFSDYMTFVNGEVHDEMIHFLNCPSCSTKQDLVRPEQQT